jgi:hypothetical protein
VAGEHSTTEPTMLGDILLIYKWINETIISGGLRNRKSGALNRKSARSHSSSLATTDQV